MAMTRQSFIIRYVWPPILIAVVLGAIAVFSVVAQEAWLAPSLASAVFSQMLHPDESGAEPVNIAVGQAIGIAAGFFGVWLAGATHAPSLTGDQNLVFGRALAVVIAVLVASTLQLASGKRTPAGGATALVAALGIETITFCGALRMCIGIVLVTVLGETARQLLLRKRAACLPHGGA